VLSTTALVKAALVKAALVMAALVKAAMAGASGAAGKRARRNKTAYRAGGNDGPSGCTPTGMSEVLP
jgi:hypothetical protein